MSTKITDLPKKAESNDSLKPPYQFGGVEVLKFEDLNLPQFELSVFASADIADGGFGGTGPNDIRRTTVTAPPPFI